MTSDSLPRYYTTLFNAVSDAVEALQAGDSAAALALLIAAQQRAEYQYMTETEEPMAADERSSLDRACLGHSLDRDACLCMGGMCIYDDNRICAKFHALIQEL